MSSNNPSFSGGQRGDILDSFSSLDFWDPYEDFPFPSPSALCSGQEKSAFAHRRIGWRSTETPEHYIFIGYVPGFKREEVKFQIDNNNRVLQMYGKKNLVEEDKNDAMQPWLAAAVSEALEAMDEAIEAISKEVNVPYQSLSFDQILGIVPKITRPKRLRSIVKFFCRIRLPENTNLHQVQSSVEYREIKTFSPLGVTLLEISIPKA